MRLMAGALAGIALFAGTASGQPAPPPPPHVWQAQVALFVSLPQRFPSANISDFEKLVADDVKVFRDGKIVHESREAWLRELQDAGPRSPGDPQGYSVSRDQFNRLQDGGISVREFSYPIAPEGRQIIYHPSAPLRYVTYYIEGGRLVRVDYGPAMSSYGGLCQAVAKAQAELRLVAVGCGP